MRMLYPKGVVLVALAVLGGCNIVAPAYLLIHGPEKVHRVYQLDKDRPTVVFVDDPANLVPRRSVRQAIAVAAQQQLLEHGVLDNVIDARSVMMVVSRDDPLDPMPIEDLGKAVEAEVVIYAIVDEFALTNDGQSLTPSAKARVKVIDCASGQRLFPAPEGGAWVEGQPVGIKAVTRPGFFGTATLSQKAGEQDKLAQEFGLAIAQLFYTHEKQVSARGGG